MLIIIIIMPYFQPPRFKAKSNSNNYSLIIWHTLSKFFALPKSLYVTQKYDWLRLYKRKKWGLGGGGDGGLRKKFTFELEKAVDSRFFFLWHISPITAN